MAKQPPYEAPCGKEFYSGAALLHHMNNCHDCDRIQSRPVSKATTAGSSSEPSGSGETPAPNQLNTLPPEGSHEPMPAIGPGTQLSSSEHRVSGSMVLSPSVAPTIIDHLDQLRRELTSIKFLMPRRSAVEGCLINAIHEVSCAVNLLNNPKSEDCNNG